MNKRESARLLSMITLAYPGSYRGLDENATAATVALWESSFRKVPYPLMEQAFSGYRMRSKYPPTMAEMAQELGKIHAEASYLAGIQQMNRNREALERLEAIMEITKPFSETNTIHDGTLGRDLSAIGGECLGASRNHLD